MNTTIPVNEGGRIILNTLKDELFPNLKRLKDLLIRTQKCHVRFPLHSFELSKLKKEYSDTSSEFFTISTKLQTPDIIFKDLNDDPQHIADFFQYKEVVGQSIADGTAIIEIIDRTLDRKTQNIENNRTLYISIAAIIISIFFN